MAMDHPQTLGRWMKRLRAQRDLTQEALADAAGCAPRTIRSFESGVRRPSPGLARRLADVLQVPPEQQAAFLRLARTPSSPAPAPAATPDQAEFSEKAGQPTHAGGRLSQADSAVADLEAEHASSAAVADHVPILATKLYRPRPRATLVARPRLLARLDAGLARPLTVIAAPAGFGKTTLLAGWLHHSGTGLPIQNRHVAWLSLDAGDSDPIQFLRYLIAALQTLAPAVGTTTLNLLRAAQAPPIETRCRSCSTTSCSFPQGASWCWTTITSSTPRRCTRRSPACSTICRHSCTS